jgi:hypothetical protein
MSRAIPKPVLAALIFLAGVLYLAAFSYGVAVQRYRIFPFVYIQQAEQALQLSSEKITDQLAWYYQPFERPNTVAPPLGSEAKRLNLLTIMGPEDTPQLKIVDMAGNTVHSWHTNWFDVWTDATHLPPEDVPKSMPGGHLHGALLLPDGDVVFNYSKLGSVRMGLCGEIRWKLPYQTHHSVFLDSEDVLWIPGQRKYLEKRPDFPAHQVPVFDQTILKVSLDGEILEEISVFELLAKNDQRALLHMTADAIADRVPGGTDVLHLNDIEVFPEHLQEGFFKHGDVVLSLRNINTIAVFEHATWRLKLLKVGGFVRQHDTDFIDGNTIMLFDNNNIGPAAFGQQSRILTLDGPTNELTEVFSGSANYPFYTKIMGAQQLLNNGHLLITDSIHGRAFELDQQKQVVWEYTNVVDDSTVGLMEDAHRIPPELNEILSNVSCDKT